MIPMLIILLPALTMYHTQPMEEYISKLMSFTKYILFPLGIHLLQGLAILPDLPLGHKLQTQNSGPQKSIRRYDGPIFLPPQIYKLLSQDAMKALKAYNSEAINRFHQRKVHNTENCGNTD